MAKMSSSQYTFAREEQALKLMPKTSGMAACEGNPDFDVQLDKNRIARNTRNDLAKVCNRCDLKEQCGWRQTYSRPS